MTSQEIIKKLKSLTNPKNIEGMARFGININKAFGVPVGTTREMAKKIGKNHNLALELWNTGYHEAKILAALIDDKNLVTEKQMDKWVSDFDSWDVCDTVCGSLLDKPPFAYNKALGYVKSEKEFVKRAGFVIFTWQVVHDKKQDDKVAIDFLKIIKQNSTDERNFVRKAVNWALRTIGKRNASLNKEALKCAEEILEKYPTNKTAKWIASNAIRELKSKKFN